jgi:hypothetical protein
METKKTSWLGEKGVNPTISIQNFTKSNCISLLQKIQM